MPARAVYPQQPDRFSEFAAGIARTAGSPAMFLFAVGTVVAWLIAGPLLHWSDSWQLAINSWTNIATFIVVFLIQNTQNRDARAMNLKLDELIRSTERAQNEMIDIERLSDKELQELAQRYERIKQEWMERQAGLDQQHGLG